MAFSQILIVMVAAIGLTIFAERRNIQPPLLLAAMGLAASFIPGLPRTTVDPQLLLAIVLPPLIYSTAIGFSVYSFLQRLGSILNLGVVLVLVTAVAGGFVVALVLPALGLPAALILGAVVAPPDAVSAVAIGNRLGLPRRLLTILTGESLINDAAALTLFSVAVAATLGTRTFIANPWLYFAYASFTGLIVGRVLGWLVHEIRRRLSNAELVTAISVLAPFAAYAVAEEIAASGVIAVVAAGFTVGHNAAGLNFAGRIQEREVWRLVEVLLESFVFAYMGLQFRFVLDDAQRGGFGVSDLLIAAGALFVVVIVVRGLWIFATALLAQLRYRQWVAQGKPTRRGREVPEPLSWRENLVLSWAGMRGVVTLAAAAGTPIVAAKAPFLARDAIIPIAFGVAIATLLVQGLTLPWLVRAVGLGAEDPAWRHNQLKRARAAMRDANVAELERLRREVGDSPQLKVVERLLARADRSADAANGEQIKQALDMARQVLLAQRGALIAERDAGRLDDEIMREVLEDIDIEEAVVASRSDRFASW